MLSLKQQIFGPSLVSGTMLRLGLGYHPEQGTIPGHKSLASRRETGTYRDNFSAE